MHNYQSALRNLIFFPQLRAIKEEIAQHELFLEGKVRMVSELLSKLTENDKEAVSRTFLAMSSSSECCVAIRRSSKFLSFEYYYARKG